MLLKITKKCCMGCSHCLENATPDGEHMSKETFEKVFKFIRDINPFFLLVSGGEPTDSPYFFEYMERLISFFGKERLLIATNGIFLYNKEFTDRVLSLGVGLQITNDVRYYPMSINMNVEHELIKYEDHIRTMYPMGRAVTNGFKAQGMNAPYCFNLRSIGRNINTKTFKEAVRLMEANMKVCSPSIDIYGNIIVGESSLCHSIGTVETEDSQLLHNLKNMKCNKCKMEDNLPLHLRMYINTI